VRDRRQLLIWFAIGLVGGGLLFGPPGRALAQSLHGLWDSHILEESYRISIGVDGVGKPRKPEKVDEIRTQYNLPQHYGNLIGVTGHGDSAVFWYQDQSGVIRNAIVPSAASKLARIEYTQTSRYKTDVLP